MCSSDDAATTEGNERQFDPDVDRYPHFEDVLADAVHSEDWPVGPIERIEIQLLASNEANWRVWPARAEEAIGGYYVGLQP